jgi:hypothetical protein
MNIRLQPGQRARLVEIAAHRGVTTEKLVREIVCRYFEEDKATVKLESGQNHHGGLGTEIAALFPKHGPDFVIESPFEPSSKAAGLHPADSRGRLSPHKPSPRKYSRSRRKKRA